MYVKGSCVIIVAVYTAVMLAEYLLYKKAIQRYFEYPSD